MTTAPLGSAPTVPIKVPIPVASGDVTMPSIVITLPAPPTATVPAAIIPPPFAASSASGSGTTTMVMTSAVASSRGSGSGTAAVTVSAQTYAAASGSGTTFMFAYDPALAYRAAGSGTGTTTMTAHPAVRASASGSGQNAATAAAVVRTPATGSGTATVTVTASLFAAASGSGTATVSAEKVAPAMVGATWSTSGSGLSYLTINRPATTRTGDVLVMFTGQRGSTSTAVAPSGWTLIGSYVFGASRIFAFSRVVTDTEANDYTYQLNSTGEHSAAMVAVRNSAGIHAFTGGSNTANATTIPTPSVTTTVPNSVVVRCAWIVGLSTTSAQDITWPTPAVEATEAVASGSVFSLAQNQQESAGATGTINAVASGSGPRAWMTVALAPA